MSCSLRKKQRISYYELEEPNLDEYIYCFKCRDYVYEYCSIHGPLLVIPDTKVPAKPNVLSPIPRAILTLPGVFLTLAPSSIPGAGLGVFTKLTIPTNVRFGPYRGEITQNTASDYCWQIYDENNKPLHMVDASDINNSNWMRYVNCSRHWCEQNLVAFQYKGELYYRTIKIIPRFSELLVFYGVEYAINLGIDLRKYNKPLNFDAKENILVEVNNNNTKISDVENNDKQVYTTKSFQISNNLKENLTFKKQKLYLPNKVIETTEKITPNYKIDTRKNDAILKNKGDVNNSKTAFVNTTSTHDIEIKNNLNSKVEIPKPSSSDFNMFVCDECGYKDLTYFKTQHLNMHFRENNGLEVFSCDICLYKCQTASIFDKHKKMHNVKFCCEYCNKKFTSRNHLNIHIRTHNGERPYQCVICNKKFTSRTNLNIHIRTHTGERPYQCVICNKKFTSRNYLNIHIRTHTGERPYQCDVCNKKFNRIGTLNVHIRTHIG